MCVAGRCSKAEDPEDFAHGTGSRSGAYAGHTSNEQCDSGGSRWQTEIALGHHRPPDSTRTADGREGSGLGRATACRISVIRVLGGIYDLLHLGILGTLHQVLTTD